MTDTRQAQELELPHRLTLDARSRLSMTGVTEVESFDEGTVVLVTTRGTLIVRGTGLHLQMLSLEGGQVSLRRRSRSARRWGSCTIFCARCGGASRR